MKRCLLTISLALMPATAMAEKPIDLGVMGSDGIIRPEASSDSAPAQKKAGNQILPHIVLKTQKQVQAIIGQPDEQCSKGKYGIKCSYKSGQFEIVYINGLADWITYNNPKNVGFYPAALQQLGISCPITPSKVTTSGDMLSWEGTCPGFVSAQIFSGGGKAPVPGDFREVFYIYLKAATP